MLAIESELLVTEVRGTPGELSKLRSDWQALYALDPQARIFQSWSWIRGLSATGPGDWCILAVRSCPSGHLTALLPVRRGCVRSHGILLERELCIGGKVGDSTGMLCLPGSEDHAITALASHLRTAGRWNTLHAFDVADSRLRALVERVAGDPGKVELGTRTAVPVIVLPTEWEAYLTGKLSSRRREDLRRSMRALERLPAYRITDMSEVSFEKDFEIVMRLRHERWGGSLDEQMRQFSPLMRTLLNDGLLWIRMFWSGSEPVAAIGGIPDVVHRVFWYYWGVFNSTYARISPGKGAFGFAIRHAIDSGFHTFSMTYGDEAFKATFGTEDGSCQDLMVRRPSLRSFAARAAFSAGSHVKRALVRA